MTEKKYVELDAVIEAFDDPAVERNYGDVDPDSVIRVIEAIPAADVRPVVTCAECKWWTKQEASLQGRCELLQMYPTGAWFCANGKEEDSE